MGKIAKVQEVPLTKLRPYERNAKIHGQSQVEKIKASIQEFGFLSPCLIDSDYNIIAGHGRVAAAKELGLAKVPCVFIEGLTEEQRRAYILADNKLTELGEWDMDLVEEELQALSDLGFDAGLTGFDWDASAVLDPIEEKPEEARAKLGDIWKLGNHRLMCGSSADPSSVGKLFAGEKARLVFTDPPYGVAIGTKNATINAVEPGRGGHIEEDIEGDTLPADELYPMLVAAFTNLRENCTDDCSYYVTSPQGGDLGLMMMMMRDAGLPVRHILIWIKSYPVFSMGRLDYDYRHEPVFYTWTKKHEFVGGYDNTIIDDNPRLEHMSKEELKELVHALKGDGSTTAIYCDKPTSSKLHPTMKPTKLVQRFVYNSSHEGDIVADIFGGSGTTMIVCEHMNRRCFMMEYDPHYCDVIIERWEQFSGQKAERISRDV